MPPLVIEGETLGQKHRNYNKIANETKLEVIPDINYNEPDLENLLKIDVACRNRNVDYILRVFQCEDMLYVSRAIKRSTWLITDPEHAEIINPDYLNCQLSPNMMTKAFNKLLLHVRLNLKDEKRVEEFFKYYEKIDIQIALKWLPNCSTKFTEDNLHNFATLIPKHRIKRTCQKSIKCLSIYTSLTSNYYTPFALEGTRIFLNTNTNEYLDIVEKFKHYEVAKFGSNATKLLMKRCSERIIKNLDKYALILHVPTFANTINRDDIKDFIIKHYKNKEMRDAWFAQNIIKLFINRLPIDCRYEFVKETFIDSTKMQECIHHIYDLISDNKIKCEICNNQEIHRWFAYAPFDTAFEELKKMIGLEPEQTQKIAMFEVMLTCAGDDVKNVRAILKYWRENHIYESSKFKMKFINFVVKPGYTHRFDKETWGYLNEMFSILGVYKEPGKTNQNYIRSIILYNVINDNSVPDVVENKFVFNSFKVNQQKLSENEKEKMFSYLYKYLTSKINSRKVENEEEFNKLVKDLTNLLNLLVDWNKELQDFPTVLDKLKEVIQIRQNNEWTEDISALFNIKKSWRKLLFKESIILSPNRESCINALKHGPQLLEIHKNEVESICLKDIKILEKILKKVRIYWPQTLTNTYKDLFLNKLNENNVHKSSIIGLCTVLSKNDLLNLVDKYGQSEVKNDENEQDDAVLNIRKHIASNIHLARPQIELAAVLPYARRDINSVLPSINTIFHNMKVIKVIDQLNLILALPIPQKHYIRLAFLKLKHDELKKIFSNLWKTNKNRNLRVVIFSRTVDFLCKNNEATALRDMWELLSAFIDDLTSKENKTIYTKLSEVQNVSPVVRPQFWVKSYKFFKSLSPKANTKEYIINLIVNRYGAIEFADCDIVAEIVHESLDNELINSHYEYNYVVVEYLRSTRNEEEHIERYNKIFVPILEKFIAFDKNDNAYVGNAKKNLEGMLLYLHSPFEVTDEEKKLILPKHMFTDILKRFRENLSIEKHYILITTVKLSLECLKIMDNLLKTNDFFKSFDKDEYRQLYSETGAELGKICVSCLKENVSEYGPSVFIPFSKAFTNVTKIFNFEPMANINALKEFLEFKHFIPGYMFLIEILATYDEFDDDVVKN